MTRALYGVAGGDVITLVASDPTTADPSHRDLSPITGTLTMWLPDRTTRELDMLACDPTTLVAGAAITVVTADATTGRTPFYGKDGYVGSYWGKDASNRWWVFFPSNLPELVGAVPPGGIAITNNGDGTAVLTF